MGIVFNWIKISWKAIDGVNRWRLVVCMKENVYFFGCIHEKIEM